MNKLVHTVQPSAPIIDVLVEREVNKEDGSVFLQAAFCKVYNSFIEAKNLPPGVTLRRKRNEYGLTGIPTAKGTFRSLLTLFTNEGQIDVRLMFKIV